jgi:hypothetical protein
MSAMARADIMADKKIDDGWLVTPVTKQDLDALVPTKHDEWVAIEYVREVLYDVRKRLTAGAEGPGATLDADECVKVLGCMKNPPDPRGRQPADWMQKQAAIAPMARYCFDLEKGEPLKTAVAMTAKHFGCSTSKVRSARKELSWPFK